MKRVILLTLIIVPLLLSGCKNTYCPSDEVEIAIDEMESLAEEWDDAYAIASSTSRMALSGPIGDMQEIKREVGDMVVPPCLESSVVNLEKSMEFTINGFIAFLGQEDDDDVVYYFDMANKFQDNWSDDIAEIMECLPKCKEP